jgi:hypothetical protein
MPVRVSCLPPRVDLVGQYRYESCLLGASEHAANMQKNLDGLASLVEPPDGGVGRAPSRRLSPARVPPSIGVSHRRSSPIGRTHRERQRRGLCSLGIHVAIESGTDLDFDIEVMLRFADTLQSFIAPNGPPGHGSLPSPLR